MYVFCLECKYINMLAFISGEQHSVFLQGRMLVSCTWHPKCIKVCASQMLVKSCPHLKGLSAIEACTLSARGELRAMCLCVWILLYYRNPQEGRLTFPPMSYNLCLRQEIFQTQFTLRTDIILCTLTSL